MDDWVINNDVCINKFIVIFVTMTVGKVVGINKNNKIVPALNYATKRQYSKWTKKDVNILVKEIESSGTTDYKRLQDLLGYTSRQIGYKIKQIKKNGEYNNIANNLKKFDLIQQPVKIIKMKDVIIDMPPFKIKINGILEIQNGN